MVELFLHAKKDQKMGQDCPLCGAPDTGGLDGCREFFGSLAEKEFSDASFFAYHRLTVDAYCLQHPEIYMVSTKSATTHLAAMYWSLEMGLTRNLHPRLKAYVDGPKKFARAEPPLPLHRGDFTVVDMLRAQTLEEYEVSAWMWARSAWEPWKDHWELARMWVAEACDV